jgi:tripartite ATP-independent transporter DctM subunit
MDSGLLAAAMVALLLVMIGLGIHINIALGLASLAGVAMIGGNLEIALSVVESTAYEALRDYVFAVIPLFVLMGELVSRSGAARDLFMIVNRLLARLPGRLAVATVLGNALFAAIVGVSVASAATFSRIAYPQMVRLGYDRTVAAGCVAGSSALGMLIPPSVLMIVWGVLTELSIGKLFLAGVIPGLLLALMYAVWCIGAAVVTPHRYGGHGAVAMPGVSPGAGFDPAASTYDAAPTSKEWLGALGATLLVFIVLGGIWLGAFTPTEAAGIGAIVSLVLAIAKGMSRAEIWEAISQTGRISAPILFLLLCAQMYSRLLAMGGIVDTIQGFIVGLGVSPFVVVMLMIVVWFVLGMFIDSVSIILLTVPIFAPLAAKLGIEPLAFAIIGIVAVEAGILTPPFGLAVYSVKSCIADPSLSLGQIFRGASPYWVALLILAVLIYQFPGLATWLPASG